MSATSSSPGDWWSLLEPAPAEVFYHRGDPEDPRLGEVVGRWEGGAVKLGPRQAAIIGFPCDEGVRRNAGRPGAALAPNAIREQLYRFTAWDQPYDVEFTRLCVKPVDLGNLRVEGGLEQAQARLGQVVAGVLSSDAIPIILGGGHETAFGHFLGYAQLGLDCAIINVDAHLDVRPYPQGGHSGSPFRQAMEHRPQPLKNARYVVIAAQRHVVAKKHYDFVVREHNGRVYWLSEFQGGFDSAIGWKEELTRLGSVCEAIMVSVDADAFRQADVPGSSAPSPFGLNGASWLFMAFQAGRDPHVRSLELVEVNPLFDRDNQTARWAAVGIRQFLVGLARRPS